MTSVFIDIMYVFVISTQSDRRWKESSLKKVLHQAAGLFSPYFLLWRRSLRTKRRPVSGCVGRRKEEVKSALAGNRTRASRVAGENSTTEPPMPLKVGVYITVYIGTVLAGSATWLSNVSFKPQLATDIQQVFDSATTEEEHDKRLALSKKRHAERSDRQAGSSEEHSHKKKKRKDRKHETKKKHSPSPPPSGLYSYNT